MTADQNVFRFDLNESLYFEKGHEVSEMISISLDPEISIQSHDDYVSIRGVIELLGEYRKSPSTSSQLTEEELLYFDDQHAKRFIEVVEQISHDRALFSHRFPVEISVPAYRIQDIDEVSVYIESFDYELPSESQLIITSGVDIYGISEESRPLQSTDELQSELEMQDEELLDETFEFDVQHHVEDKEEDTEIRYQEIESMDHVDEDIDEAKDVKQEEKTGHEDQEEDRWKLKTQTFSEFFDEQKKDTDKESEQEMTDDEIEQIEEDHDEEEHFDGDHIHMEEYDEDSEETRQEETDLEDVNYLTSFFRNKEEEEPKQASMRLCIVQSNDTLETIAEKYKITTMQLLKRNALENETLREGQLLYIPSKGVTLDYD